MTREDKTKIVQSSIQATNNELVQAASDVSSLKSEKMFLDQLEAALQSKADGLSESVRRLKDIERRVGLGEL